MSFHLSRQIIFKASREAMWHRVAAIAGASGVGLGAYGAHGLSKKTDKARSQWSTAAQNQLLHALALATLPAFEKTRARTVTGVLFTAGITLFSGSIYTYVLTEDKRANRFAPTGGVALILGWVTMALLKR